MPAIYHRPKIAADMCRQLLHPGVLDEGLRSGLFLSGLRRTGKTTFLLNDLIPALEEAGALVIYVDLWSDIGASPTALVQDAIRKTLSELETPGSAVLKKLLRVASAEVEAYGFKFGFDLDKLGTENGVTLAQAFTELVDQAKTDVVVIIDEVQQVLSADDGAAMMLALKAARDAINARPGTPGHFLFIGTGSHRALVKELTTRRNQAFAGATSVDYPVLNGDFVEHVLGRLRHEGMRAVPSVGAAVEVFEKLGSRPEEFLKALRILQAELPEGSEPDSHFKVIAGTIRATAAELELLRLERIGLLAPTIFDRIAAADDGARCVFSADAAAEYSRVLGREVRLDEVQSIVNEMVEANLIMRRGHGIYLVADPFVRASWLEQKRLAPKTY